MYVMSANAPIAFPIVVDCLLFSPPGKPVEDTAVFAIEQGTEGTDDHETEVTTAVTTEEIVSI